MPSSEVDAGEPRRRGDAVIRLLHAGADRTGDRLSADRGLDRQPSGTKVAAIECVALPVPIRCRAGLRSPRERQFAVAGLVCSLCDRVEAWHPVSDGDRRHPNRTDAGEVRDPRWHSNDQRRSDEARGTQRLKPAVDRAVTYEVIKPLPVLIGPIGPQVDPGTCRLLSGRWSQFAMQVEPNTRMQYLRVLAVRPIR